MMEAVRSSAVSVSFYQITWRSFPEARCVHTLCREKIKSHVLNLFAEVKPLALMMEAASTSETSVNFYQAAWHNISENSRLCV
jgi:hypothetical protein